MSILILSGMLISILLIIRCKLALLWTLRANQIWYVEATAFIRFMHNFIGDNNVTSEQHQMFLDKADQFYEIYKREFPSQTRIIFQIIDWSYDQVAKDYQAHLAALKSEVYTSVHEFFTHGVNNAQ